MSKSRDRCIQPGGASAIGNQKAQKRSDCCDTPFRRGPTASLRSLQYEVSQRPRMKPSRIFSEILQQITKIKAVVVKGGIAGSALLPHPAIKRNQEGWLLDGFLIDRRRQYASAPEISDKQTNAVLQLQPMRTTVPWASA